MAIVAKQSGNGERVLPPAGTHPARCYYVVDLGTQKTEWQGELKRSRKIRIGFELTEEKHVFDPAVGEEPFTVSKEFTLSLGDKANLRHTLESWRGRQFTKDELDGFDITKLLGASCLITIVHERRKDNQGDFAKITSIAKIPKGMQVADGTMSQVVYEIAMGRNDVFAKLPEWMQEKIKKSEEFSSPPPTADAERPSETPDDADGEDVPF